MTSSDALRRIHLLAYGLPGLAAALPVIPVAVLLPSWYARDLGLGMVVTGVVLGAARLLDFVTDPLVGVLADRWAWRGLRFKPWIAGGALVAGAGLVVLATPGEEAGALRLGFGALCLFSGWTALMIPYTAWGAEFGRTPHQRTLLAGSREVAGLVGMLLALTLPVFAGSLLPSPPPPFVLLTLTAVTLGLPGIVAALALVPEPASPARAAAARASDFRALLGAPAYRGTITCWLLNGIANGLPAALFPVVVGDYFGFAETALFLLLALYFGAAVLAAPAWLGLSRRTGKIHAWRTAILANLAVFTPVLLLGPGDGTWFWLICGASGCTLGADLALPAALQADVMAADRAASGRARTASAFALWSMATKLALAIAIAVAFIGVGATSSDAGVNRYALMGCYALAPIVLKSTVYRLLGRLSVDLRPAGDAARA